MPTLRDLFDNGEISLDCQVKMVITNLEAINNFFKKYNKADTISEKMFVKNNFKEIIFRLDIIKEVIIKKGVFI